MYQQISEGQAWTNLINSRWQTERWDLDQTVTKETMREIIDEVHARAPCKQNQVHYGIHVLDWTDTSLRNEMFEMAVDRDNPNHKYNPQTLSNWLVVFTGRIPQPISYDYSDRNKDLLYLGLSSVEIGLASYMLIHSAAARGLQSGFCRCLDYNYEGWETEILPKLGLEYPDEVQLLVGIGIESDNETETFNPHTNTWVESQKSLEYKWNFEAKPPQDEYIHWYV